jgi:hypothetical protein
MRNCKTNARRQVGRREVQSDLQLVSQRDFDKGFADASLFD